MSESAHCEMDVLISDYLKFKMVEGLRKSTLTEICMDASAVLLASVVSVALPT